MLLLVGDVFLSAACISYTGAFTGENVACSERQRSQHSHSYRSIKPERTTLQTQGPSPWCLKDIYVER
jgi:hypothetical protein